MSLTTWLRGDIRGLSHSSRPEQLPKVQGTQSMNEHRYILASLAKGFESQPLGNNMFKVMAKFLEELDHVGIKYLLMSWLRFILPRLYEQTLQKLVYLITMQ
jgi:hypothetical protein